MRTYSRKDWTAAQQAWDDGEFGYRWQAIRRIAAERGFIYPPTGSPHDDRDDEQPSQRAIIYRAIEDNPRGLEAIVRRSHSWTQVVAGVVSLEAWLRESADLADRERAAEADSPSHREATMALGNILARLDESR